MIQATKIFSIFSLVVVSFVFASHAHAATTTVSINPGTITYGESTNVSWTAMTGGESCSVTKGGAPWRTGLTGADVATGLLYENTSIVVTCIKRVLGVTHTETATIVVNVTPVADIYIRATSINQGRNALNTTHVLGNGTTYEIRWSSSPNTTTCTGEYFSTGGATNNIIPSNVINGGVNMTASTPTVTYTLTCMGPGGSFTDNITVNANNAGIANPPLARSCGIDIALVMDNSGSIDRGEMAQMKNAMKDFVGGLNLPEVNFSLTNFSRSGTVISNFTDNKTTIIRGIDDINADDSKRSPTNWQDGLHQALRTFSNGSEADKPNLIIFASDGRPTVNNEAINRTTSETDGKDLINAVSVANAIKSSGTRIMTVGIGDGGPSSVLLKENLMAISGFDDTNTDYAKRDIVVTNFASAALALAAVSGGLVPEACHNVQIPSNVDVVAGVCDSGTMTVSWDYIPGASGYKVYRNNGVNPIATIVQPTTSPAPQRITYRDTGLSNETVYTYSVSAMYPGIDSTKSLGRSASIDDCDTDGEEGFSVSCRANATRLGSSGNVQFTVIFDNEGNPPYTYNWTGGAQTHSRHYSASGAGPLVVVTDDSTPPQTAQAQCPYITVDTSVPVTPDPDLDPGTIDSDLIEI